MGQEITKVVPFNSEFEVGFRALVILEASFPRPSDLQQLVFFDYLLLHSGDVQDGPPSLHPPTPYRSQEYTVRRQVLESGLLLMASRGLIGVQLVKTGIEYVATELTTPFLDRLTGSYVISLKERATWVSEHFGNRSVAQLSAFFSENVGQWGSEFLFMRDFTEELETLEYAR